MDHECAIFLESTGYMNVRNDFPRCLTCYRVIVCNCNFLYRSDRHQKTKKRQNPTIFVKLRYRHFDILMSQYSQMKTSHGFQGCAKIVLWLHTARTENPDTPQKHPSASDIHEYRSDTSKNPPDIPQTPPRPLQGA